MKWFVFLGVYLLQILVTLPTFYATCASKSAETWLLYFLHHALDVFLFWSFLFLTEPIEFVLHFLLAIAVAVHWFQNNNTCILTVYMNRMCGYDARDWLDSLKNRLGLRAVSENFHFIWIGLLLVQDSFAVLS